MVLLLLGHYLQAVDVFSVTATCRRFSAFRRHLRSLSSPPRKLPRSFAEWPGLVRLSMSGVRVDASALECLPHLRHLALTHCKWLVRAAPPSVPLRLKSLVLDVATITADWACSTFPQWFAPHSLSRLSVRGCHLLSLRGVALMCSCQSSLRALNMSGIGFAVTPSATSYASELLDLLLWLPKLKRIGFRCHVPRKAFGALLDPRVARLEELDLNSTFVGDETVSRLGFDGLKVLLLQQTRVTSCGVMACVDQSPNLERLSLIECIDLNNQCVACIASSKFLVELGLKDCLLTAQDVQSIVVMKRLKILNLDNCGVQDEMLTRFTAPRFAPLTILNLRSNGCGNAAVRFISDAFPLLQIVSLGGNDVTDAGVAVLSRMRAIKILDLSFVWNVTLQGLEALLNLRTLIKIDLSKTVSDPKCELVTRLAAGGVRVVWFSSVLKQ